MPKKQKIIIKSAIGILILFVVMTFVAQVVVKNKIVNVLENDLPESVKLKYSNLSISLFSGCLEIQDIEFTQIADTTNTSNIEVTLKELRIDNIGYWDYLFNETIHINGILLATPDIRYYQDNENLKQEKKPLSRSQFNKTVQIDNIQMEGGAIKIVDAINDSLLLDVKSTSFSVNDVIYNSETNKNKMPIEFSDYSFGFEQLFFSVGEYENLTAEQSKLTDGAFLFTNLTLKTKYSKRELSRMIAVEKDHYNIEIDSINVKQFHVGFRDDSILQINSPQIVFSKPNMRVFRDKLVADDLRNKLLYSKMLRDLKFDLKLDTILVKDAFISYSEKVKIADKVGEITFSNFNAIIANLSNSYTSPTKTTLLIDTEFMDHAPLHAKWEFDVNNRSDLFLFQADIGELQAPYLNTFTVPNMNKRIEGELEKTYFTISGDSEKSNIDFKVKFDHFKVEALKKNGTDNNVFVTDVLNLFVTKNSNKADNGLKEVSKTNIKRDKTKSVFNFIWLSTRAGLLRAMTID